MEAISTVLKPRRRRTIIPDSDGSDNEDILDTPNKSLKTNNTVGFQVHRAANTKGGGGEGVENIQQQAAQQANKQARQKTKSSQPRRFSECSSLTEVHTLAKQKVPLSLLITHVPLPDEILMPEEEVKAIIEERQEVVMVEYCNFPQHATKIERLTAENQVLKLRFTDAKVNNASLAGDLARYKGLAERILAENEDDGNDEEALKELVGGLLAWNIRAPMLGQTD